MSAQTVFNNINVLDADDKLKTMLQIFDKSDTVCSVIYRWHHIQIWG